MEKREKVASQMATSQEPGTPAQAPAWRQGPKHQLPSTAFPGARSLQPKWSGLG